MITLGYALIVLGAAFIYIGLYGIYKFNNFYARLLAAADIDTFGVINILLGVIIISGINSFSFKVALLMCIILIINPIVSSSIASSAYFSGYKIKEKEKNDDNR